MTKGRVFVLALESGENIKSEIEGFCRENSIVSAKITVLGGVEAGSSFVCGPKLVDGRPTEPVSPMTYTTDAPTELAAVGTVFPNEHGEPVMHMHGSLGRNGISATGCFRDLAYAWLTLEVIIEELIGTGPVRRYDPGLGVSPLTIE